MEETPPQGILSQVSTAHLLRGSKTTWGLVRKLTKGMRLSAASCVVILLCGGCSCVDPSAQEENALWSRVELNLAQVDDSGLRGPSDGKVAVAYEFVIPNTEDCRAEVAAIDPTVQFLPGSRGRIGAGIGQCLCIGSTHQDDYREVLRRLASLPYVDRIVECHFE